MMLDHLGHRDLHDRDPRRHRARRGVGKNRTPDLGGQSTTKQLADAVVGEI